jgi:ABC-type Zn uptake system ZnuABC Zn-binding protein ZnuA
MEILRSESKIKKRKINLKNLEPYNKEKIKLAQQRLNQVIENSFVSHFDNVTYFFQKQKNKDIKFSKFNKNTGCISECKKLKKELKDIGIKTYFVSCNANGFSNKSGDNLVKEAHVFLINPSQRNGKIYFTIFDPGFRMTNPISFFNKTNSPNIP